MYKRTKYDSPLKCPYCEKQFRMTMDRYLSYKRKPLFGFSLTECKGCGKRFYYRNLSAAYVRKTGKTAIVTVEEYKGGLHVV